LCSMACALAQAPPPQASAPAPAAPPIASPEVHADRTVTFRFRDPNAKDVLLSREGATRTPMTKDETGVWTITTAPLEPDYYGYSFVADGVSLIDPANPVIKPNLRGLSNMVHVPGPSTLPWESRDVPHGEVHHHFYKSDVIGDDRDYFVYTPPGYDPKAKHGYPVLYLFHGFSDDASAWTAVGRANIILDNLIAEGKAKPMLMVMPLGYGVPEVVKPGSTGLGDPEMRDRNYAKFRDALFLEVMPQVEKSYRVAKDHNARAIAGLSMGGAESLYIGLNALDKFAYIGSFSAGGSVDSDKMFSTLDAKANQQIRALWIACGTDDRLIDPNRKFREFLTTRGVHFEAVETPGAHVWMVWRRNLAAFAPLLFQASGT
jgi:enterochelin esterase-like enzyme